MHFNDTCFGGNLSGCADNEMGYLFWVEGITPATPGPFVNVQPYFYLTETVHSGVINPNMMQMELLNGFYGAQLLGNSIHAWAVHNGDVASPIPEPQTYAMLLTGLGLLGFLARRRN